jgi:hypothetical protein
MRGPIMTPSSMARLSPKTGPPMSRTVVKPLNQRRFSLSRSQQMKV